METGDCGNLSSKTMAIFKEYLVVFLWYLISILNVLFCISVYFIFVLCFGNIICTKKAMPIKYV